MCRCAVEAYEYSEWHAGPGGILGGTVEAALTEAAPTSTAERRDDASATTPTPPRSQVEEAITHRRRSSGRLPHSLCMSLLPLLCASSESDPAALLRLLTLLSGIVLSLRNTAFEADCSRVLPVPDAIAKGGRRRAKRGMAEENEPASISMEQQSAALSAMYWNQASSRVFPCQVLIPTTNEARATGLRQPACRLCLPLLRSPLELHSNQCHILPA